MLVPLSWLEEYVDIPVTPDVLTEKLFDIGFEVEEKHKLFPEVEGVVVGLVKECEAIPDTHLHLCRVDAGSHGEFQICCGADNVRAGKKFPLALVGATVYATGKDHMTIEGTMKIKVGKLRGYESQGMLCAGIEIGLTEDFFKGAGYNGLLELPDDFPVGEDVRPLLHMDDWIFDISITANRPDCQSIVGIAREVAAVLNTKFHEPDLSYTAKPVRKEGFKVTVKAPELCPRYIGHYVSDIRMGESPDWMKRRLSLVGIHSISNIVDITNYVLKELGQPMHAFDAAFLEGNEIVVRRAEDGEKIVTLDEKEFTLSSENLVICDGNHPVALAGIMGGLNSEIRETTREVIFESAKFMRDNIRKTSRSLGQSSDSSQVFAKGVQEYTTVMAISRALHLIEELDCGIVSETHIDINTGNDLAPRKMEASIEKTLGVLGISIPKEEILRILTNLNFNPQIDGDKLTIYIPSYREDMDSYPDIAEELIRLYGYDHIVPTMMPTASVTAGGRTTRQKALLMLRRALASVGCYEAIHYSFFSPADLDLCRFPEGAEERKAIAIMNPINVDLSLMRTTLVPEMLRAMARNEKRKTYEGTLFEIGKRFIPKALPLEDYPDELDTLCIGTFGEKVTFSDIKGYVEAVASRLGITFTYEETKKPFLHPYRTASILWEGEPVGYMGQVRYEIQDELSMKDPSYVAEIDLSKLEKCFDTFKTYEPIPKFDIEKRDFAFVVDSSVSCQAIEEAIRSSSPYVTEVRLFDIYEGAQVGEGKKSMAFSVVFTPKEEAFTEEQVDGFVKKILKNLERNLGAILRS